MFQPTMFPQLMFQNQQPQTMLPSLYAFNSYNPSYYPYQYYLAGFFNFPPGNFAQPGTFNFTQPGSPASGQIQNIIEYFKSSSPATKAPSLSHLQSATQAPSLNHLQLASPASSPIHLPTQAPSLIHLPTQAPSLNHLQLASPASSRLSQPITPWTNFEDCQFDDL
ncbi:hypothetical protein TNCT_540131 [Trichonephila clavata]|uniref:Uncharacterized protein n=1 Tax=Trichonephila clavata TaxID=2740835 RepID=A0A8X6L7L6_TRICU|nr:hypothetical protein TNCT_540131 [Trichonephila clavata]